VDTILMKKSLKQLKLCKFFLHGYWNIADFEDLPTNGKHCRKCKDNLGILNAFGLLGTTAFMFTSLGCSFEALFAGLVIAIIIHGTIHQNFIMKYVKAIHR
jgi:hypothetical protein